MSTPVFTRVLVGWDGSSSAVAALRIGCSMTAFPAGNVIALSVIPTFGHVETDADRELAATSARRPLQDEYERIIQTIDLHPEQRVSLRFVEDLHVASTLDAYADQQMVDLVIVGLHGREGVLHPRMGHIADHVVRSTHCPVLVVPDPHAREMLHDEQSAHHREGREHLGATSVVKGLFHPGKRHCLDVSEPVDVRESTGPASATPQR